MTRPPESGYPPPSYGPHEGQPSAPNPYGGQPQYGGQPPYGEQPPYGGQPQYGGEPQYGGQPPYGEQPAYGGQPQYGGQSPYGGQPPYGGQSPYGGQPPAGGQYPGSAAGYGSAPPPVSTVPTGVNGFAVTSLVLSLCGGGLLGLIFGIVALIQTKRTGQRGRGMAIAGTVISSLYLVAIVVAVIIGIVTSASRDASGQINDAGSVSLSSLKPGDCMNTLPTGLTTTVDALPCSQPHHAEVFATFSLTGGSTYPGDETVNTQSDSGCTARLKTYSAAAAADDTITIYYFAPTRTSWSSGDRVVICVAADDTKQRTGSIKG